jgi:C4-type Zn-finger protein
MGNQIKKIGILTIKGRLQFTLIITDTQGGSYIIPLDKFDESEILFNNNTKNKIDF